MAVLTQILKKLSMKNLHELQAQQRSLNGGLVDLQNQLGAESIM